MAEKIIACVVCKSRKFQTLFSHRGGQMGRCVTCGLVQVVPMPSAREIAKLYHEDLDHFAPYIEQIEVHREYFRKKLSDIRSRVTGDALRVLDVGCAMGVLLEEAKKQGIDAVGIDISKDAVAYSRKRGLTTYAGTVQSVKKLAPAAFDAVTAFQVIEHERDPLGFMQRVHTLLKKGGMGILATPNYGGMWRRIMGRRWFGFAHPEHVVLLDHTSMRTLLTRSGFRDIEIRRDSARPFPLSFAFKRAADYFPFLAWFLVPLGNLLDRFKIKNPLNPWDDMIVYARK